MSDDLTTRVAVNEERTRDNTRRLDSINGSIGRAANEVAALRSMLVEKIDLVADEQRRVKDELVSQQGVVRDELVGELTTLKVEAARQATRIGMLAALGATVATAFVTAIAGWVVVHQLPHATQPSHALIQPHKAPLAAQTKAAALTRP